jgi:IS30 family transposase
MNRRYAREATLPLEVRHKLQFIEFISPSDELHVAALRLYEAGWTLRAIADSFVPSKSRSTIQYWIKKGAESLVSYDFDVPIPDYATHEDGYQRLTPVSPGISPDVKQELSELSSVARYYRSGMASTSVQAVANSNLNALVRELVSQNVKVAEIARACGVTHRAISRRLDK